MKVNRQRKTIIPALLLLTICAFTLIACESKTPYIGKMPKELEGSILIYARDSCPDCQAIKEDLVKAANPVKKIYLVDDQSDIGKKLLKDYHVEWVPSAYYVPYHPENFKNEENIQRLDTQATKEIKTFDQVGFDRLLQYQKEKR